MESNSNRYHWPAWQKCSLSACCALSCPWSRRLGILRGSSAARGHCCLDCLAHHASMPACQHASMPTCQYASILKTRTYPHLDAARWVDGLLRGSFFWCGRQAMKAMKAMKALCDLWTALVQ